MNKVIAVLVGVSALCAAPLYAQSPEDEAATYYEKSGELYYQGDFAGAIFQLRRAYALLPDPIFLYNISLAQLKMGKLEESLATADAADISGLPDPDRTLNLARRSAISTTLTSQTVASTPAPVVVEAPATVEPAPTDTLSGLSYAGLALGVTGVVLTTGGVIIGAANQSLWTDYQVAAAGGDEAEYSDLQQKLRTRQTVGRVMLFSGLPLVAIGTGMFLWGSRTSEVAIGPGTVEFRAAFR